MRLLDLLTSAVLLSLASARAFTSTNISSDAGPTRTVTVTKTTTVLCAWGFYFAPCPGDSSRWCCVRIVGPSSR